MENVSSNDTENAAVAESRIERLRRLERTHRVEFRELNDVNEVNHLIATRDAHVQAVAEGVKDGKPYFLYCVSYWTPKPSPSVTDAESEALL